MGRGRGHLQPPDVLLRSGNKLEGTDDIRWRASLQTVSND